ncbi:DNA primase large subunit PriL [Bienertia sinuspersici]
MDRSATTINRHKNKGEIRAHSNALKPGLTEANKRRRVKYCINQIEPDTLNTQPKFNAMANIVHIDEKWFFLTRKNLHMYLASKEKGPHRSTKSKNSIQKVMFMSAVARPRRNSDGAFIFPEKIGIWPFTYKYVAKKSSVNRPRGTVETKAITKVNKIVFKKMMTENVIPAIKAQWPREEGNTTITIQADNAKPRGGADIYSFIESYSDENFTFKWAPQPANSPDLNILDLGLFNSLQSKYQKTMPETIDKMVEEVEKVYEDQHPKIISNVWHSLQYCMCEIIGCLGQDHYDLPHMKKQQFEDAGNLPWQVEPNKVKVEAATEYLNQPVIACAALRSGMQATIEAGSEEEGSEDEGVKEW